MKTLRQIVSEVAQPKAGDEKDFKDKHIINKVDHPVAPDHAFTGNTKKAPKRRADYDKGEDETVYEGSFDVPTAEGGEHDTEDSHVKYKKGNKPSKAVNEAMFVIPEEILATEKNAFHTAAANAHKSGAKHFAFGGKKYPVTMSKDAASTFAGKGSMKKEAMDPVGKHDADIDNDGDTDKSDKYLINRRKAITKSIKKEGAEGLDEISRDLARRYIRKIADKTNTGELSTKEVMKRRPGVNLAGKKAYPGIAGEPKVRATESVELEEKLKASSDMGTWIKDFKKSDAPQFKGKSQEKRRQMAIAAKYGAEREAGMREEADLDEAKLSASQRDRLDSLISNVIMTTDPSYYGNDTPQKYLKAIEKEFGAAIAKQVDDGSYKTHWGRDNQASGHDKLASRQWSSKFKGGPRVTAAGKMNKQDVGALKTRIKNDKKFGGLLKSVKLPEEADLDEDAYEEIPMMMRQLEYIAYAAGEIMDYLEMDVDPEEWYQNKLAAVSDQMQSLHAYMEGDRRVMSRMSYDTDYDMYGEEVEQIDEISQDKLRDYHAAAALDLKKKREKLDKGTLTSKDYKQGQNRVTGLNRSANKMEEVELEEDITKMSHGRLKWHMNSGVPHGSYTKDEMKKERDRRLKTDPMGYRSAKAGLNEVTRTALKRTISYTDAQGKSRTRNVPISKVDRDEDGEEKIRESVELIEVFSQGIIKLKDGASVILKKEDADLLNQMLKDLSSTNRKKMEEVAMKDKNGFNEILSFAREAL